MAEDHVRTLLNDVADREPVVDVDQQWEVLLARASRQAPVAPAGPIGDGALPGPRPGRQQAARRRAVRGGISVAVAALVASTVVVAVTLSTTSKAEPRRSSAPSTTVPSKPFVYLPTGAVPGTFVAYASGSQQVLEVFSTSGKPIRTLADDAGLLYAQNKDGILTSPDGHEVYYLDLLAPSPPGPGIGIYRIPARGGTSSLVAYGTDPAISPDGAYLAYSPDPAGGDGTGSPVPPVVGLVDLATSRRSTLAVSSLFGGQRLSDDVVIGLAWLAGGDDLAVVLLPQATNRGATGCGSTWSRPPGGKRAQPKKCPPPPPPRPTALAIVRVGTAAGSPAASAVGVVAGPQDFRETLEATGPVAGSLVLVGQPGGSARAAYQVLVMDLLSRPTTSTDVGQVPAGCYPFAVDAASGAVLCDGAGLDIVRLGRSGPPTTVDLPAQLIVGNAAW